MCSKEAVVQEGLKLCRGCNDRIPNVDKGRELEGFLLASWCRDGRGGTMDEEDCAEQRHLETLATGGEGGKVRW